YDHGNFRAFLSYEAKHRLEIHFHVGIVIKETGSRNDNTIGSPLGFVIHWIEVFKGNEKVTEVIYVENWQIDNSRVLRKVVSLIEWSSSISSTESSIQSTFRFK
ncbi:hypothetical protein Tco_1472539, partial [Tanacetum coccineum]